MPQFERFPNFFCPLTFVEDAAVEVQVIVVHGQKHVCVLVFRGGQFQDFPFQPTNIRLEFCVSPQLALVTHLQLLDCSVFQMDLREQIIVVHLIATNTK